MLAILKKKKNKTRPYILFPMFVIATIFAGQYFQFKLLIDAWSIVLISNSFGFGISIYILCIKPSHLVFPSQGNRQGLQ